MQHRHAGTRTHAGVINIQTQGNPTDIPSRDLLESLVSDKPNLATLIVERLVCFVWQTNETN